MTKSQLKDRYERQIMLPEVGEAGQKKLFNARVLIVGAGGLGSPAIYYLTAAGVGTIGVVDRDKVEITNLQRQIIYWEKDVGMAKVVSAQAKMDAFNAEVRLEPYAVSLDLQQARELIPLYDLVIGAVDNIQTRKIINQVCFEQGKPWIDGGVNGFNGILTTFKPPQGPCYNCICPSTIDNQPQTIGVMGVLPGIIGTLQAQEALKLILGIGDTLVGKLLVYNALQTRFDVISLNFRQSCPICTGYE